MTGSVCRLVIRTTSVVALTAVLCATFATAPAYAGECNVPFSGRYTATSDGEFATTNYKRRDQLTVTTTWTIETTCTTYLDCTGSVVSDGGWEAPVVCSSGVWKVNRHLPDWIPCPDGTTAPGRQLYLFRSFPGPEVFEGWDMTTGPSGACGVNRWLNITMPFKLTKL